MPEPDTGRKVATATDVRRRRLSHALIVLGIVLGLAAVIWHVHGGISPRQPLTVSPGAAGRPSSEPLSKAAVDAHRVPPADPRYIAIPAIDVDRSPVLRLGMRKDGLMATPGNIHQAGWFADSARPGKPGAMFIYGHVSSWKADGIFHDLKQLRPGDMVTVTAGDGTVYRYEVIRSSTYPYDNVPMDTVLEPTDGRRPGLNLMTCAGRLIEDGEFSERLVVYTSLVQS